MPEEVSIPQAVGTVATIPRVLVLSWLDCRVSIPQAVGTVATMLEPVIKVKEDYIVSIPQAVGTVATQLLHVQFVLMQIRCFNTASGRYCCNYCVMH